MSISTLQDYQTTLYETLYGVEHSVGLDLESFVRNFGWVESTKTQLINEYYNYRKTLPNRVARPSINIH
jgi:hypothetical protein